MYFQIHIWIWTNWLFENPNGIEETTLYIATFFQKKTVSDLEMQLNNYRNSVTALKAGVLLGGRLI